jgi:hypothetical protein
MLLLRDACMVSSRAFDNRSSEQTVGRSTGTQTACRRNGSADDLRRFGSTFLSAQESTHFRDYVVW